MILGFDPGRDKCGVAVMSQNRVLDNTSHIAYAEVVPAEEAIATVLSLIERYPISTIVMGDQTMSKTWKTRIEERLAEQPQNPNQLTAQTTAPAPILTVMIDERYSTLEARDRYWQLHPPQGLTKLVPQTLRTITRPIDDVVAIILIERYWRTLESGADELSVSSVP